MTQYVRAINIANNSIKSFVFDTNTSNTLNTAVATAATVNAVAIAASVSAEAVNTFVTLQTLQIANTPPTINTISITDSSYNIISNTIANPVKTYLKVTGSNFQSGVILSVGSSNTALSTTYIDPLTIQAELPLISSGTYPVYVINNNGGTAIRVNGIRTDNLQRYYVCGDGDYGALGLNDVNISRSSPTQVGTETEWNKISSYFNNVQLIKTDGTRWTTSSSPTQVGSDRDWISMSALAWGIKANGTLWSSTSTQFGTSSDWQSIISYESFNYFAIKTNGTLWAWGDNDIGVQGISSGASGSAGRTSSPIQVGSNTNWANISVGEYGVLAVKTDGTLWAWGRASRGRLGTNNEIQRSSPVQVGTDTNWRTASISAGGASLAIKTDGTLWAWGENNNGELGLNDQILRSSPVQVGTTTNWSSISISGDSNLYDSHAVAIKTDGTLWAWGFNDNGELGLNNRLIKKSSPTQVGTSNNWIVAVSGNQRTHLISRGPFY